jgi:Mn-dependent DtxR family transcriptional regulator
MQLTATDQQFLVTALAAPRGESRVFNWRALAASLRVSFEAAEAAVRHLEKHGYLNRLPNDEAILTDAGRSKARELGNAPRQD